MDIEDISVKKDGKSLIYDTSKKIDFDDFFLLPMCKENKPKDFLFLNEERYSSLSGIFTKPFTENHSKRFIFSVFKSQMSGDLVYYNVYSKTGELAGFIFFDKIDGLWQRIYAIKPEYEGLGWMRKSSFFLFNKLHLSHVKSIMAYVKPDNIHAIKRLEKEGFTLSGKRVFFCYHEKKDRIYLSYTKILGEE